jgi:polyketide cyclase/dehydrase/lipid transport protein
MKQVAVEEVVAADPMVVYQLISDVTRMGEWSPETKSCRWLKGASSAEVGARFRGSNQNGWHRWSTTCTVTTADPGKVFAFKVDLLNTPVATWEYEITPEEGGCRVTERWTDCRPNWLEKVSPLGTGVTDRGERNRLTMSETLSRLRDAAERRH